MRNVAVEGPVSRIICHEFHVKCFARCYIDCIFYKPILNRDGIAVTARYRKLVPMDMNWMGVVPKIAKPYPHFFSRFYLKRGYIRETPAVHCEKIEVMRHWVEIVDTRRYFSHAEPCHSKFLKHTVHPVGHIQPVPMYACRFEQMIDNTDIYAVQKMELL